MLGCWDDFSRRRLWHVLVRGGTSKFGPRDSHPRSAVGAILGLAPVSPLCHTNAWDNTVGMEVWGLVHIVYLLSNFLRLESGWVNVSLFVFQQAVLPIA